MEREMEKEFTIMLRKMFMKENGKMIKGMEMGQ